MTSKGNTFNFGDLSAYSSGGGVPEGDYVITDFTVKMHSFQKQDGSAAGPARLGVMITLMPLAGGDESTQFYSLGSNADKSWAPNPETGKGIIAVPGGPGTPPNASTNWSVFVKSLFDSGLPQGILSDDLSVLEGMHVHISNIPEPEERKGFVSKTGEAGADNKVRTIAVVTEIKDDGKPWEGTGGTKAAKKPNGVAAHASAKPVTAKAAPAKPASVSATTSEDLETEAQTAVSAVLEKFPNGLPKIQLRTSTFKEVSTKHDAQKANSVTNTYFKNDDALNGLLNPLGYEVNGSQIVASA